MNSQEGVPVAVGILALPFAQDLSQLFGEHHRRVLRAACRITGDMADAEDVAQAVFLRLANGDAPISNVGSYLYRAAINGSLDLLRRRRSQRTEPLDDVADRATGDHRSSPEAVASNQELANLLRLAIGELSPRSAEMFTLRYVEELGNREIARLMGTSQAVVAVTLHHARSKLRKRLTELERGRV
jgi:RNA polymerase sigma-70 factor (ECF subfamily)